ncbi:MAG: lipopolysaccharide biosynthesis protein [Acidobacteriota bacterium]
MIVERAAAGPDQPDEAAAPAHPSASSPFRLGETMRQAGMLFSAQTFAMGTSFLAAAVQWRWMEPAELGRFVFCVTIVEIAGLLFEVGIFPAGARVLALARDQHAERRALGALFVLAMVMGAAFSVFVAATAYPIDLIFHQNARSALIGSAVFLVLKPFQSLVEQACQGLNHIRKLSAFQLLRSGLNLSLLAGLALAHRLTAESALIAYLTGIGVSALVIILRMRPSFEERSRYTKLTLKEARSYGLNVYLARITGTVSTEFDNLVIAYFLVDPAPLGLYATAQKLASPILTMARSLAVTRFRAFAHLKRVPARLARWNAATLIAASAALAVAGPVALRYLFPQYAAAAPLLVPFAVWGLFAGLYQPYNMFLASHGRGVEIRNIAVIVTLATFAGLIVAVPRFGIAGAAWACAAAMVLDYLVSLYYYRKFSRTLDQGSGSV